MQVTMKPLSRILMERSIYSKSPLFKIKDSEFVLPRRLHDDAIIIVHVIFKESTNIFITPTTEKLIENLKKRAKKNRELLDYIMHHQQTEIFYTQEQVLVLCSKILEQNFLYESEPVTMKIFYHNGGKKK